MSETEARPQRSVLPPLPPDLAQMLAKMEASRRRRRDDRRSEFAARREIAIPALEFLTPDCSVCGLRTECDGDSFWCVECRISWGRNGEDAERWDNDSDAR